MDTLPPVLRVMACNRLRWHLLYREPADGGHAPGGRAAPFAAYIFAAARLIASRMRK
ncbi:hypothetical protein Psi02_15080 [Planotetraspora silvatica]|uniref:Uncharacterized protein n=1 Tax=Planotetraspora silvatica TaxID=234614 RepID=A0A8J3UGD2_9ACTN|nr:hypothetical protein Psi02_15080 [Planotetraspora silvatica]